MVRSISDLLQLQKSGTLHVREKRGKKKNARVFLRRRLDKGGGLTATAESASLLSILLAMKRMGARFSLMAACTGQTENSSHTQSSVQMNIIFSAILLVRVGCLNPIDIYRLNAPWASVVDLGPIYRPPLVPLWCDLEGGDSTQYE